MPDGDMVGTPGLIVLLEEPALSFDLAPTVILDLLRASSLIAEYELAIFANQLDS